MLPAEEKAKYAELIDNTVTLIKEGPESEYVRGEFFGYFCNRLVKRFMIDPTYTDNSFNSAFFNETKKKSLANYADSISAMVNRSDPIHSAEELDYVLTALVAKVFAGASYGWGAYVRGILQRICQSIETVNTGSQKDATMAFRRHLILRGVFANLDGRWQVNPC